jgi:hypothetical protein
MLPRCSAARVGAPLLTTFFDRQNRNLNGFGDESRLPDRPECPAPADDFIERRA